jgi:hypothetical protein
VAHQFPMVDIEISGFSKEKPGLKVVSAMKQSCDGSCHENFGRGVCPHVAERFFARFVLAACWSQ